MRNTTTAILLLACLGWILVACTAATPEVAEAPQGAETAEAPYPFSSPTPTRGPQADVPYPSVTETRPSLESAYPAETEAAAEDPNATPFTLEKPIVAGDTFVRGTGPAGVPIIIMDVTSMGIPLGQVTIGEDGTFEVEVQPLGENYRIGIALGDLSGTDWTEESFQDDSFEGDEAKSVPLVGFFFDTAMVGPGE